jgi:hypothetical protein
MLRWYALPTPLQKALAAYKPDGREFEPMPPKEFAALRRDVVTFTDNSVAPFAVPYHGKKHFTEVRDFGMQAAKFLGLHETVQQSLENALYSHDAFHCGCTFRHDAKKLSLPKYGRKKSAEWVTSAAVDDFLAGRISVPARLHTVYVHWSSTFGGATPKGKQLGIPNTDPKLISGWIMKTADVCRPRGFMTCIQRAIYVNYLEVPATPPPTTWEGFCKSNLGFCDYIDTCCRRLNAVSGTSVTNSLGWNARTNEFRTGLKVISNRDSELGQQVDAELRKHGIVLS